MKSIKKPCYEKQIKKLNERVGQLEGIVKSLVG